MSTPSHEIGKKHRTKAAKKPVVTSAIAGSRRTNSSFQEKRRVKAPSLHIGSSITGLKAHALVTAGVSTEQATKFMASLRIIGPKQFFETLGISERTFQRRAASKSKSLDTNASDRALRLSTVLALATGVLGSRDEAERWLSAPAIGLDRHTPIDLLQSTEGTELVKTLLTRMDYGVYA